MIHGLSYLFGGGNIGPIPLIQTGRLYEFYKYVQTNWRTNKKQQRLAKRNRNIEKRRAH